MAIEIRARLAINAPVSIAENTAAYAHVLDGDHTVADRTRIACLRDHRLLLHEALEEGCNVGGTMPWSLRDNFEWHVGHKMRFGLVFVDFVTDRTRRPKAGSEWFRTVAGTGNPV